MASTPPPKSPAAGGVLIALGAILGAGVGLFSAIGPTRGFLIGLALGVGVALAMWWADVRRGR